VDIYEGQIIMTGSIDKTVKIYKGINGIFGVKS